VHRKLSFQPDHLGSPAAQIASRKSAALYLAKQAFMKAQVVYPSRAQLLRVLLCTAAVLGNHARTTDVYEWTLRHASSRGDRDSSSGSEFGISCLASLHKADPLTASLTHAHSVFGVSACKPLRRSGANGRWSVLSDSDNSWPSPDEAPILIKHGATFLNSELLVSPEDKSASFGLDM